MGFRWAQPDSAAALPTGFHLTLSWAPGWPGLYLLRSLPPEHTCPPPQTNTHAMLTNLTSAVALCPSPQASDAAKTSSRSPTQQSVP